MPWLQCRLAHSSITVTNDLCGHFEREGRRREVAKVERAPAVGYSRRESKPRYAPVTHGVCVAGEPRSKNRITEAIPKRARQDSNLRPAD